MACGQKYSLLSVLSDFASLTLLCTEGLPTALAAPPPPACFILAICDSEPATEYYRNKVLFISSHVHLCHATPDRAGASPACACWVGPPSSRPLPESTCCCLNICHMDLLTFSLTWSIHKRLCYVVIYLQFSYFLGTSCRTAPHTKQTLID